MDLSSVSLRFLLLLAQPTHMLDSLTLRTKEQSCLWTMCPFPAAALALSSLQIPPDRQPHPCLRFPISPRFIPSPAAAWLSPRFLLKLFSLRPAEKFNGHFLVCFLKLYLQFDTIILFFSKHSFSGFLMSHSPVSLTFLSLSLKC